MSMSQPPHRTFLSVAANRSPGPGRPTCGSFVLAIVWVLMLASIEAQGQATDPHASWIATWAASPQAADPDPHEPLLRIEHQTVRERARLSIGGEALRVQLSNEHGSTPLVIGSATIALAVDAASVKPGSLRALTFDGRRAVTLPPGA